MFNHVHLSIHSPYHQSRGCVFFHSQPCVQNPAAMAPLQRLPVFSRFRAWTRKCCCQSAWYFLLLGCLLSGRAEARGAVAQDSLLHHLEADISDGRLDHFRLIEAAFVLSGVTQADTLALCNRWYEGILEKLRAFRFDASDRIGSASTVFAYLHLEHLVHYKEEATTLVDVIREKRYNCVAGTILFNIICTDLGWSVDAFETPTHVYTIFPHYTREYRIENTSPMGFNIMANLRSYSQYLLRYYPQHRAAQIGLDRIYAYENDNGRRINNVELLGLLAYNQAYFAMKKNEFGKAYEYVLLAQKFNQDSKSNVQFEIALYFQWGKVLFDAQQFRQAFTVYADGYYRYPDESDLGQNCLAAFFHSMRLYWHNRQWAETGRIIQELLVLEVLKQEDSARLQQMLSAWILYHQQRRDRGGLLESLDVLEQSGADMGGWRQVRENAMNLPN